MQRWLLGLQTTDHSRCLACGVQETPGGCEALVYEFLILLCPRMAHRNQRCFHQGCSKLDYLSQSRPQSFSKLLVLCPCPFRRSGSSKNLNRLRTGPPQSVTECAEAVCPATRPEHQTKFLFQGLGEGLRPSSARLYHTSMRRT